MKNDVSNPVLEELLDSNQRFALGARGTTNHCPMVLVALAKMGASPAHLRAFFAHWENQFALPALPVSIPVSRQTWHLQLGRVDQFEALQVCLQQWIAEAGVQPVLLEVLQKIPFAPATGAFHALIRLAYGLEARHTGEIAAGLAFLITRNLDIDLNLKQRAVAPNASEALVRLSKAMAGKVYVGVSIVSKLRAVVADSHFDSVLQAVPPTEASFAEMAGLAIAAYAQTKNFIILHMVTAMHAARLLFGQLPPEFVQDLLPQLWIAFCAAYVAAGAPLLPETEARPDSIEFEPWSALLATAQLSMNEHLIKFSYSCHQENLVYANPRYFASVSHLLDA